MRPITPDAMRAHAHALAQAFGCRVVEQAAMPPEEAAAFCAVRVVVVAPIIDETTYAVVLHELGHLIAPAGNLRNTRTIRNANLMRDEEDAAWAWARHHALVWTDLMESVARWAEDTYQHAVDEATPQAPVAPTQTINWDDWS